MARRLVWDESGIWVETGNRLVWDEAGIRKETSGGGGGGAGEAEIPNVEMAFEAPAIVALARDFVTVEDAQMFFEAEDVPVTIPGGTITIPAVEMEFEAPALAATVPGLTVVIPGVEMRFEAPSVLIPGGGTRRQGRIRRRYPARVWRS